MTSRRSQTVSLWPDGSWHSVGNNQIELVRHLPPFRYPLVYQRERMFGNTISDVQFPNLLFYFGYTIEGRVRRWRGPGRMVAWTRLRMMPAFFRFPKMPHGRFSPIRCQCRYTGQDLPEWGFGSITKSDISIPRAAMAVARQH